MQPCGKCKPCLNPHFKKACTEVKAARELERSSHRSSHTIRRARLSATNIPLAKLDHEAAIITAEAQHEEQLSNKRVQRDSPSPSAVSDHEQHCLSETAQAKKRAATEDSDNYGCSKRICFSMRDPEQAVQELQQAQQQLTLRAASSRCSWRTLCCVSLSSLADSGTS